MSGPPLPSIYYTSFPLYFWQFLVQFFPTIIAAGKAVVDDFFADRRLERKIKVLDRLM
jgi:hypothetical protein